MPRLTELVVARCQLDLLGDNEAYLMIETYERGGKFHSKITCPTYLSPWAHQTFPSAEFPRSCRELTRHISHPFLPPLPSSASSIPLYSSAVMVDLDVM